MGRRVLSCHGSMVHDVQATSESITTADASLHPPAPVQTESMHTRTRYANPPYRRLTGSRNIGRRPAPHDLSRKRCDQRSLPQAQGHILPRPRARLAAVSRLRCYNWAAFSISVSMAGYARCPTRVGLTTDHSFVPGIEGFPETTHVLKLEHEKNNFGGIWHSDTLYLEKPPMATMLLAKEVPPYGGKSWSRRSRRSC